MTGRIHDCNSAFVPADQVKEAIFAREIAIGGSITEDSLTGYTLTSGDGAYGAAVELLQAGSTPIIAGKTHFMLTRIGATDVSVATPYLIRLIWGISDVATAEAAKQYTTFGMYPSGVGANVTGGAIVLPFPRLPAGTKVWAKCKNATNGATVTFLIGIYEFPNTDAIV